MTDFKLPQQRQQPSALGAHWQLLGSAHWQFFFQLFIKETQSNRPWTADDVSDGTLRTLALLVAANDPRISAMVVEEPENSVHPWIIKELAKRLREASKKKTIFFTTHSPTLIDVLYPEECWIVSMEKGETKIRNLTELAPELAENWREGKVGLSEYLDSGLIPQAVPGGVV